MIRYMVNLLTVFVMFVGCANGQSGRFVSLDLGTSRSRNRVSANA